MARKTIEEFKAAWQATQRGGKGKKGETKTGGGSNIKNSIAVKRLDEQAYIVNLNNLQKIQLETANPAEFAGAVVANTTDLFKYSGL